MVLQSRSEMYFMLLCAMFLFASQWMLPSTSAPSNERFLEVYSKRVFKQTGMGVDEQERAL